MTDLVRPSSGVPSRRFSRLQAIRTTGSAARRLLGFKWSNWLRDLRWYRAMAVAFAVLVALPTTVTAIYYTFIAASLFESSVRLAVYAVGNSSALPNTIGDGDGSKDKGVKTKRGSESLDATKANIVPDASRVLRQVLAKSLGTLVQGDGKDPYFVVHYVQSRAVVADLNRDHWLENLYHRTEADAVARLSADPSHEDLWRYFENRIDARVDSTTRLVTLTVRAFTAEDAKLLADRVVAATEQMVNRVRDRQIRDTMTLATKRLDDAENRYIAALAAVRALREDVGIINPEEGAKALAKSLTEMKILRVSIETELMTKDGVLSADSPIRRNLNARIEAIDAEIADLERQIAGQPDKGEAVASYLVDFENRETDRLLAQAQYQQAIGSFDRAQTAADTQGVFLAALTAPSLPEKAEQPHGVRIVLIVFLIASAAWSIICLAVAGLRDQLI